MARIANGRTNNIPFNMPKILITGKQGQVGFELRRSLAVLGDVVVVDRTQCDLSKPEMIRALVRQVQPDIIVNPAAYTAVDKAESERELVHAVNAVAPEVLAQEAAELNALLVHYSTDYVFDGRKSTPYVEDDAANPQSVYGQTKWAGEEAIRRHHEHHLIFRTSWVFGAHGNNFLKTILRLARERDQLKIVADQHGAPTPASLIADVTAQIIGQYLRRQPSAEFAYGTCHLSASGDTTWHGYAKAVLQQAMSRNITLKVEPEAVEPIPTSAYPLPAQRPANSRLNTDKLRESFGLQLPSWHQGVEQVMALLSQ